ncbi:MAG TPA: ABC transporter permease [Candidatus Acidoferrales bacterium]|nr:ABC transporter permease [Candidatus Acidoferrales bacterium]
MKGRDLSELALRNLREAFLRNSLTTLGIAVGVASLVAMVSLGVGLQDLATDRLAHSGLFDAIFVTPKSAAANFRGAQGPIFAPPEPPKPLDEDARQKILALPNVVEVYPDIRFPTEIHFNGNPFATMAAGVAPSARKDGAFDGMKGSFFSGPDADEAILQIDFARQLSDQPDSLIGKSVVLRYAERQPLADGSGAPDGFSIVPKEKNLRIVGIVETEPAGGVGSLGRGRLLIPLQLAQTLRTAQANDLRDLLRNNPNQHTYESLTVRVNDPPKVKDVEESIKDMGFTAFSLLDASKGLSLVFTIFDLFLGIFGSLALVVASLGIVNTLVMAILERRREIGIFKALGASDRDIRRLFFVEAGAMGTLGGIIGLLIGRLIGLAINFGTNVYLKQRALPEISVTAVHWWMAGLAILFAILVSLAAGIYPASRAASLDPVEALRYE